MKDLNLSKHIKHIPEKHIILNEFSNSILKNLKIELKEIYNKIFNNNNNNNNYTNKLLINKYTKGNLFNSIPIEIQNIIKNENENLNINTKIYSWMITIKGSIYNITFNINYGNKTNNGIKYVIDDNKLNEYYKLTRMIIEFLVNNKSTQEKTHTINIYLYLTTHIKLIPDKKTDIVSWINVNTGLTTFCNENTEINIFRAEEWFKVLIHETIHNLCMDFSSMDTSLYDKTLKGIFIIDSDYLLFETYTELWAEIIQMLFINILNNSSNINELIMNEFKFSILQSNKIFSICTQQKGTYNDLINKNKTVLKLYKEDSNCFSYYTLKMIGLYNINDFILWCSNTNGTNLIQFNKTNTIENINSFIYFFKERYTDTELIEYINSVNELMNKYYPKKQFIYKTLRISIYEIII